MMPQMSVYHRCNSNFWKLHIKRILFKENISEFYTTTTNVLYSIPQYFTPILTSFNGTVQVIKL